MLLNAGLPKRAMRSNKTSLFISTLLLLSVALAGDSKSEIGREGAIPHDLQDGEEFTISLRSLLRYGEKLFRANLTIQEGAGRPLSKGTGNGGPLSDPPILSNFREIPIASPVLMRTRVLAVTTNHS